MTFPVQSGTLETYDPTQHIQNFQVGDNMFKNLAPVIITFVLAFTASVAVPAQEADNTVMVVASCSGVFC